MTDAASPAPAAVQAAVEAIVGDPGRLGLTWNLIPGTVTSVDPLQVICDGDTVAIGMVSMIGPLTLGNRVYVIQIPPAGNFVLGSPGNAPAGVYLARETVTTLTGVVTFLNIPTNLRTLTVKHTARSDFAGANIVGMAFRVNGDTNLVYNSQVVFGGNVTPQAAPSAAGSSGQGGLATAALAPGNTFGSGVITFMGWDLAVAQSLSWEYSSSAMGNGAANFRHDSGGGAYTGGLARTSLSFFMGFGAFVVGSDIQLEGIYS